MFLDPASIYQKFFVGLIIYASSMRGVDTFAMIGKIEVWAILHRFESKYFGKPCLQEGGREKEQVRSPRFVVRLNINKH